LTIRPVYDIITITKKKIKWRKKMFEVIKETKLFGKEVEGEYETREEAELRLIDVLAYTISNFDEYECADIDAVREQGYERYGSGVIYIVEDGIAAI
jgi:hypothetical protein